MLRFGLLVTLCAVLQVAVFADPHMFTINGHTMVHLRAFCRQFGAVADYDAPTNTFSVSRNDVTVYLIPYCPTAWINDTPETLRNVPLMIDGSLYVPMRFMCRAFGLNCTWGPGFLQVVIIDSFTHAQITWARDAAWDTRPHAWQHPADYRYPLKPVLPPRQTFHGTPLPPANHAGHRPANGAGSATQQQLVNGGSQTNHGHGQAGNTGNSSHGNGGNAYHGNGSNSSHGNGGNSSHGNGGNSSGGNGGNASHGNGGNASHGNGGNASHGNGGNSSGGNGGNASHGNGGNSSHGNGGNSSGGNSGGNASHGNGGNSKDDQKR